MSEGDPLVPQLGTALAEAVQLPDLGHRATPGGPSEQVAEAADRAGAGDAVGGQPDVALEVDQRRRRVGSEDAVDPAGVEAEAAQTELQVSHVVTPEHGGVEIKVAVAESEARLHEAPVGPVVDQAVLVEAPFGLEGQECPGGIGPELGGIGLARFDPVAGLVEAAMEVPDGRSAVTGSGTVHGRISEAGWARRRLAGRRPEMGPGRVRPRGGVLVPGGAGACPWPRRCGWPAGLR